MPPRRSKGRDASRLLRTLRVLATLTGQAAPDRRIWQSADINKATLRAYDDHLERVHLAAPVPAFESNRLKRLTAYPKRFLADTALALTLAGLDASDLGRDPGLAGRYVESFVMQQLRPYVDRVRGRLMHLRTTPGEREIDAVIETGGGVILGAAHDPVEGSPCKGCSGRHPVQGEIQIRGVGVGRGWSRGCPALLPRSGTA